MIDAQPHGALAAEDERVVDWRARCLVAAGYDVEDAFLIALDTRIDLHSAIELIESGCPADLAAEILL